MIVFDSLQTVTPPSNASWQSLFLPNDLTLAKAKESPFHVYHPDFYAIVGSDPRLAVVRETEGFYSAHEAPGESEGRGYGD
jgi:gluconolactonase